MLTKEMLESEGYDTTKIIKRAVYILNDGTLWNGCQYSETRHVEHRETEAFTSTNRYDGNDFWEEIFLSLGLVMIIPESKQVMIHPKQVESDAQKIIIRRAVSQGFEVVEYS